ncbi:MAG: HlyC/CorC family transporter [Litorivicinus sp.]
MSERSRSLIERIQKAWNPDPQDRDELLDVLRDAHNDNLLNAEVLSIIEGALQVAEMQVRDVMIPRAQVVEIRSMEAIDEFMPRVVESAHSRFPVINDADDVVGVLLAKDLLPLLMSDRSSNDFQLKEVARPARFVPESKRLDTLLREFRDQRFHMALVVDEFGEFAGLVTIEDVLEQIVGDIEDEHDIDEDDGVRDLGDNVYMVKATLAIEDFNEAMKTQFADDEFDTIGGIVVHAFGHLPAIDEKVVLGGWEFEVTNADNRRVHLFRVAKAVEAPSS